MTVNKFEKKVQCICYYCHYPLSRCIYTALSLIFANVFPKLLLCTPLLMQYSSVHEIPHLIYSYVKWYVHDNKEMNVCRDTCRLVG